jgi:cell division protein FtsB
VNGSGGDAAPAPAAAAAPAGPPPAAKPSSPPDFPFLVAAGIALLAALVLVRNLLPTKKDLADTLRREENLRREIEALKSEKGVLEMREKALGDDPAYIRRVLRGQTGMTEPGEFIVR